MVDLLLPSVRCNLECEYCYQRSLREPGKLNDNYELDYILSEIEKSGERAELAGGEVLLMDEEDLEKILKVSCETAGEAFIQTNGVLIDDVHLNLFEKYNVEVAVSVDGWGELNDLRWAGNKRATRKNTQASINNLERLAQLSVDVGICSMVSNVNVGQKRVQKYKDFLLWLSELGINYGEMMFLRKLYKGTGVYKEAIEPLDSIKKGLMELAIFFEEYPELLRFPFDDMQNMLKGNKKSVGCFWRFCDPWVCEETRGSVIDATGECSWICWFGEPGGFRPLRGNKQSCRRALDLYYTSYEKGGCRGCRFFSLCLGHCPQTGINNDFRNRSIYCDVVKTIFEFYEQKMLANDSTPFSQYPERKEIEEDILSSFRKDETPSLEAAITRHREKC